MSHFTNPDWHTILAENGLTQFTALWKRSENWFEPPNLRRGGWSGVSRIAIEAGNQRTHAFLKRQRNHVFKSLRHPIRGESTLKREFDNICLLHRLGIPTLEPLFFGIRNQGKECRAVLLTLELESYRPLSDIAPNGLGPMQKRRLIQAVAEVARKLHCHKLQHGCFYPKHIFVKADGEGYSVCLIDLEKLKRCLSASTAILRDIDSLNRHTENWSRSDRLRFFLAYRRETRLRKASKRLLRKVLRRSGHKRK